MPNKILVRKHGNLIIQNKFLTLRFAKIIIFISEPQNVTKFHSLSDLPLFCDQFLGNTALLSHCITLTAGILYWNTVVQVKEYGIHHHSYFVP